MLNNKQKPIPFPFMHTRHHPVARSLLAGILLLLIVVVVQKLRAPESVHHSSAEEVDTSLCGGADESGHGRGGEFSVRKDAQGDVVGYLCTWKNHYCTAGPDGVWTECSFPPDFMVWPKDVPADPSPAL